MFYPESVQQPGIFDVRRILLLFVYHMLLYMLHLGQLQTAVSDTAIVG